MQLEQLKEKNMRHGNRHLAARITAMQEAGRLSTTDENEETSLVKSEDNSSAKADIEEPQDVVSSQVDVSRPVDVQPDAVDVKDREPSASGKPPEPTDTPASSKSANSLRALKNKKMPIHLNLDDTSRFTNEVTV